MALTGPKTKLRKSSEEPGREDPEVTSDLMTPHTMRADVRRAWDPCPAHRRVGSRLRAHLESFLEKGLGALRPQLRRDTAAGDRWEPPPSAARPQVG